MKINEYSVYRHINKINGKQYIGITKQIPERRWGVNGTGYKSTPHFYNAIKKYGWDNFEHQVIICGLDKETACRIEVNLIKAFKTQDREYGYNVMNGGSAPTIPSEIRRIMSEKMRGNKNGCVPCSEEKKEKLRTALTGKPFTMEHRLAISKAKQGGTHKPISEEARKKIADAHKKKPVYCEELDLVFPSVQECARKLNLYATNVSKCCSGKIKTTGGYHLKYNNT